MSGVQYNLSFQFVHMLLDFIMSHQQNDHVYIVQEAVQIMVLIRNKISGHIRIIDLDLTAAQMTLHTLQHLKCRALSGIIYIFLISQTVETHASHIGQAILLAARVRPKFIGGERAIYDESLKDGYPVFD